MKRMDQEPKIPNLQSDRLYILAADCQIRLDAIGADVAWNNRAISLAESLRSSLTSTIDVARYMACL
jgi:hypothetical protein